MEKRIMLEDWFWLFILLWRHVTIWVHCNRDAFTEYCTLAVKLPTVKLATAALFVEKATANFDFLPPFKPTEVVSLVLKRKFWVECHFKGASNILQWCHNEVCSHSAWHVAEYEIRGKETEESSFIIFPFHNRSKLKITQYVLFCTRQLQLPLL